MLIMVDRPDLVSPLPGPPQKVDLLRRPAKRINLLQTSNVSHTP